MGSGSDSAKAGRIEQCDELWEAEAADVRLLPGTSELDDGPWPAVTRAIRCIVERSVKDTNAARLCGVYLSCRFCGVSGWPAARPSPAPTTMAVNCLHRGIFGHYPPFHVSHFVTKNPPK